MVETVTANFDHIVVLLNVGAIIDTTWFADNERISSAVLIWQGGMEGGLAAADVLTGEVNPSGKLPDTCVKSFDDYPSSENFHESDAYVKYTEDIFVGYRYFETIPGKKDCVVYPFGYGLSYTTFELTDINASNHGKNILVTVTVTNTGKMAGKEVVQIYYSAPEGKLTKPARILCGFEKTNILSPGESQELCISFPIEDMASFDDSGVVAASWNPELLEVIGRAGALEVKENNLSIWLTPALNIHRSPLCGRNFEYYSEDPFLSGKMAAATVRGIQSQNIVAVPKHFACNNKETNRKESDSVLSERALREIYLKGFEICVKESEPKMIMTAYNLINGVRVSENAELLTGILRGEWGFRGMITSDWNNKADHEKEVKAGNDVRMPIGNPEKLLAALNAGTLRREELCVCVKRILEMILWLE